MVAHPYMSSFSLINSTTSHSDKLTAQPEPLASETKKKKHTLTHKTRANTKIIHCQVHLFVLYVRAANETSPMLLRPRRPWLSLASATPKRTKRTIKSTPPKNKKKINGGSGGHEVRVFKYSAPGIGAIWWKH